MTLRKKVILGICGILIVFLILMASLSHYYIDYLWFVELDYLNVFFKEVTTKLKIILPVFIVLCLGIYGYLRFLSRLFTRYLGAANAPKHKSERIVSFLIAFILALGISVYIANSLWSEILTFLNRQDVGQVDPLFGLDTSFYFFVLPLIKSTYQVILSCYLGIVVITVLFTVFILFLKKDFRIQSTKDMDQVKDQAKSLFRMVLELASLEIGIFLGIFFLLLAGGIIINRFEMVYGGSGMVYGAGAADIAVGMKVRYIGIAICLVAAVLSVVAGIKRSVKLIAAGPIALVGLLVVGGVVQTIYENAVVVPNQFSQEAPYIENNIQSTRQSFGFDTAEIKEFSPDQNITATDLQENESTLENIPINDHSPTKDMYNSLQGIRNYYEFIDVDVDRYTIDGEYTQVFVSTREMNTSALPDDAKTWVNEHLKYTHGFGIAMSPVNKTNSAGQPELLIQDIPPISASEDVKVDEPRIYFGEAQYDYAIVKANTPEFDYPEGDNNQETWYEGEAGIRLTPMNKLLFALNEGSTEMLLSSDITSDSRILINRNVMDRVKKLAPFLEYDDEPYIVLDNGRLYWIINGYITSDKYPYAQPYGEGSGNNYIKNPVKIVVDAYNGDVNFYKVEDEPILSVYADIFPGLIKDIEEMPEGIKEHIRYSKTLFNIQADVFKTYHMVNTQVFYNREDQWETANQFFGESKEKVPVDPAYIIMKLPDRDTEFMLTNAYTPKNKDNMIAWLAAVSDGEDYGRLLVYQFPKQEMIYGPMQIEQRVDQDTTIAPQLTLLSQQGSRVLRGNMQTIPIEDAIIYVEPIYIQASHGENNLPEAKKVVVAYQNQVVMENTLSEGIAKIFGYDTGEAGSQSAATESNKTTNANTASLSQQANTLFNEATEAQKNGDWSTYGKKLDELGRVLKELEKTAGN